MKSMLFLLTLSLLFTGCRRTAPVLSENHVQSETSPEALFGTFRKADTIWVVYPGGNIALEYLPLVEQIKTQRRARVVIPVDSDSATESQLNRHPVFLLGTPLNNHWIADYLPDLPVQFSQTVIQAGGFTWNADSLVLQLGMIPQPGNPTNPIGMITAWNQPFLMEQIHQKYQDRLGWMIWNNTHWQVFNSTGKAGQGQFLEENRHWVPDSNVTWNFSIRPDTLFNDTDLCILGYQKDKIRWDMEAYIARIKQGFQQIEGIFHHKINIPVTVEVYGDPEYKGMACGSTKPGEFDPKTNRVRIIRNAEFPDWDSGAEFLGKLHQYDKSSGYTLNPSHIVREGMPLLFTQNWMGAGWKPIAGHMVRAGITLTIYDLFTPERFQQESPIIRKCFAAAYIDWLNRKTSTQATSSWWLNPNATDWPHFHQAAKDSWAECLAELANQPPPQFPKKLPSPSEWNGFNLAHEGYNIYNGYFGNAALKSIDATQQAGANTVAIIPYTGMEDPNTPSQFFFDLGAGSESDESVARLIHHGRNIAMHTMVKPQIWLHKSWPGDIQMKTEPDWRAFFRYYGRWMAHFALLAEIHGADVLCVGVEMGKTTQERPQDWIEMVGKIRSIFSGKITYAANWGTEFEDFKIASAVDFIGLNGYYPLSDKSNPTFSDLENGWKKIADKINRVAQKTQKPIVLTEIGYCSMEEAWKSPHDDRTGMPPSPKCQKMCYKAMTEVLSNSPTLVNGTLIWKWPAYMKLWDDGNTGFRPIDDEALSILSRYWESE